MHINSSHLSLTLSLPLDILILERVQRHATKFILNDYTMDYKYGTQIITLDVELQDILFFIRSLKHPSPSFNI